MYLHVCRHVCVRHTCTYALDTAPMSQDTCRYSQIHTDTGMCISNVQCAYQICIELYPVHMSVHMCAVCDSHTCTYINPYVCYMCFTYMHICTGRITDDHCLLLIHFHCHQTHILLFHLIQCKNCRETSRKSASACCIFRMYLSRGTRLVRA